MNRRELVTSGYVNFPLCSNRWKNTQEGGMFVQLVVLPNGNWAHCCGANSVGVVYTECLQGDDKQPNSDMFIQPRENAGGRRIQTFPMEDELFPLMREENVADRDYHSSPMYAAITLGTTGWSGWDKAKGEYWRCTRNDLTEEGKRLYALVGQLYPDCDIRILTWLDT